jgi:hypothetical protein
MLALIISIVGLVMFAVLRTERTAKFNWLAEVGRMMFWVGLLAFLVTGGMKHLAV